MNRTTHKKYNLKTFFCPIRLKMSGGDIIKFKTKRETLTVTQKKYENSSQISAGRIFDKQIDTSAGMKIKWRKCQRLLGNFTIFMPCHAAVDDIRFPSWWNWTQNQWNGERERYLLSMLEWKIAWIDRHFVFRFLLILKTDELSLVDCLHLTD